MAQGNNHCFATHFGSSWSSAGLNFQYPGCLHQNTVRFNRIFHYPTEVDMDLAKALLRMVQKRSEKVEIHRHRRQGSQYIYEIV